MATLMRDDGYQDEMGEPVENFDFKIVSEMRRHSAAKKGFRAMYDAVNAATEPSPLKLGERADPQPSSLTTRKLPAIIAKSLVGESN